jgi:hypothetical protein
VAFVWRKSRLSTDWAALVPCQKEWSNTVNIAAKTSEAKDGIVSLPRGEIPDHKSVIVGELAQNGDWIVANISTGSFWPITSQKVRWRGLDFWVMPIMKGFYPAVSLMVPPGRNRANCEELVMRFISMLSWVEERGFMVEGGGLGGGNLPRPMGRDKELGLLHLRRVRPELLPGGR